MFETVDANFFVLTGKDVQVSYSATSITGKPLLTYRDANLAHSFTGDEIRSEETPVGQFLSVTLRLIPDLGTQWFSLLLPTVKLRKGAGPTRVELPGIRTLQQDTPFVGSPPIGQIESYDVIPLRGSAEMILT